MREKEQKGIMCKLSDFIGDLCAHNFVSLTAIYKKDTF